MTKAEEGYAGTGTSSEQSWSRRRSDRPSRGVSHTLSWSGNDAQSRIDHGISKMDERSAEGPDRC